ncbi:MAG: hypothetical protein WKF50_00785 [Nocardioides sp.]
MPSSNAKALAKGLTLLRNGGVADVAEAEPPHGASHAVISGPWAGGLVIATVREAGTPEPTSEVVSTGTIAGVQVDTIEKPLRLLRFEHGAFSVGLRVLDDSGRYLSQETLSLVATILCPSECGDLPDGADG